MKKLIFLLLAVLMTASLQSCKDIPTPDIKFDLCIEGELESQSGIHSVFDAKVTNAPGVLIVAETPEATQSHRTVLNSTLEDYITEYITSNIDRNTLYTLTVKGYVAESHSGITVSVYKIFSNVDQGPDSETVSN